MDYPRRTGWPDFACSIPAFRLWISDLVPFPVLIRAFFVPSESMLGILYATDCGVNKYKWVMEMSPTRDYSLKVHFLSSLKSLAIWQQIWCATFQAMKESTRTLSHLGAPFDNGRRIFPVKCNVLTGENDALKLENGRGKLSGRPK